MTKKEKVEKVSFTSVATCVDENGLINDPNLGGEFNSKLHSSPNRRDFDNEATYWNWKAVVADAKSQKNADDAVKFRQNAEDFTKFGDPASRAKMKRRQRLIDQLAALDQQLQAEGIEVE
jgi:hypothetical protein|tara:strand:- start:306 stop:665 length:360 start_codon:yes stop_codon:yes gene_type:complete